MACKGGTLKRGTDNYYPNAYYKVGDLFLTTRNENPSIRFGGTWELFGKGKTLVCVDENDNDFKTVKQTGGEKTHSLDISELPEHDHDIYYPNASGAYGNYPIASVQPSTTNKTWAAVMCSTAITGGNKSHNNIQPYITCYIWIRTA